MVKVVIFTLALFLVSGCSQDRSQRLRSLGDFFGQATVAGNVSALSDSTTVPDVVHVGSSLPGALHAMRAELRTGYTIHTQTGDALGEGGGVTHSVSIRAASGGLCLRLRYDPELDRFHIVGFFTERK